MTRKLEIYFIGVSGPEYARSDLNGLAARDLGHGTMTQHLIWPAAPRTTIIPKHIR